MNDLLYTFSPGDHLESPQFCIIIKLRALKFDVSSTTVSNHTGQGDLVVYLAGAWITLQLLDIERVIAIQLHRNNFKAYSWLLMLRLREHFHHHHLQS